MNIYEEISILSITYIITIIILLSLYKTSTNLQHYRQVIIYRSDCPDSCMALAIAKTKFDQCDNITTHYIQFNNIAVIRALKETPTCVYFLGCCPKIEDYNLLYIAGIKIYIWDHADDINKLKNDMYPSRKKNCENEYEYHPIRVEQLLKSLKVKLNINQVMSLDDISLFVVLNEPPCDMSHQITRYHDILYSVSDASCELVWKHFYSTKITPSVITYIGAANLLNFWHPNTNNFTTGYPLWFKKNYPNISLRKQMEIMLNFDENQIEEIILLGATEIEEHTNDSDDTILNMKRTKERILDITSKLNNQLNSLSVSDIDDIFITIQNLFAIIDYASDETQSKVIEMLNF